MTRFVYVGGSYVPYAQAHVHVEDRGFQFADAVYEVIEVKGGQLIDEQRHLDRLDRNLGELSIPQPVHAGALAHILRETMRRNRVSDGLVYIQVSRGRAPRDFLFSGAGLKPTLVCIARRTDPTKIALQAAEGIAVTSMPDVRWGRCDIKTVMLLPAVLAKECARQEGAREAWLVDEDGFVTEGASSNAWIVDGEGRLATRGLGTDLLPGITRATVRDALAKEGLELVERPFRIAEAYGAREAFNTAATATVMPVVRIDGRAIADGRPGPVTRKLRAIFHRYAQAS